MGSGTEGELLLPAFTDRCNVSSRLHCVAVTELWVGVLPGEQRAKTKMVLKSCGSFLVVLCLFVSMVGCSWKWLSNLAATFHKI